MILMFWPADLADGAKERLEGMNELGDRIGSGGLSAAGMQVEKLLELGRSIRSVRHRRHCHLVGSCRGPCSGSCWRRMAPGLLAPNCEIAVFSWLCAW